MTPLIALVWEADAAGQNASNSDGNGTGTGSPVLEATIAERRRLEDVHIDM